MSTTLTIRNLEESVKHLLRMQAASHGRSMEAEARDILSRRLKSPDLTLKDKDGGRFDHLVGIWQGRGTTDQLMQATRGED